MINRYSGNLKVVIQVYGMTTRLDWVSFIISFSININNENQLEDMSQLFSNGKWNKDILQQAFNKEVYDHVTMNMKYEEELKAWDKF